MNEAPVIISDGGGVTATVSVDENQTAVTTIAATDVDDSDTQTYSVTGGADQTAFGIDSSTGELFFITAPDHEIRDIYEVEVTATDDDGLTDVQTLTVSVNDVNEVPVITSNEGGATGAVSVDENQMVVTTVTVTDVDDSDTQTYSLTGGADQTAFSINSSTGELSFVTAPDYEIEDTYEIEITVTDSGGLTGVQTLTVSVNDVNEAPVITSDGGGSSAMVSVDENQTAVTTVTSSDPDIGATHTYSVSGGVDQAAFTIDVAGGVLTFTSTQDHETKDRYVVDITVTDDGGQTDVQTLTVKVLDVDESPIAESDTLAVDHEQALKIDPLASLLYNDVDPEGGTLTLVNFSQPQHGTLILEDSGLLEYKPDQDFAGRDGFDYEVEDSGGNRASAHVWLDVQPSSEPAPDTEVPKLGAANEVIIEVEENPVAAIDTAVANNTEVASSMITSLIDEEVGYNNIGRLHEPVTERNDDTSRTSSADTEFVSLTAGIVIEQAEDTDRQRLSTRPVANAISTMLQLLLEHDISSLAADFDLDLSHEYQSIELRDAIFALRDQVDQLVEESSAGKTLVASAPTIVGASLTAGVVTWVLRSGLLVSATITATPLWRPLDPVPILTRWDEDEPWYGKGNAADAVERPDAANDPDNSGEAKNA